MSNTNLEQSFGNISIEEDFLNTQSAQIQVEREQSENNSSQKIQKSLKKGFLKNTTETLKQLLNNKAKKQGNNENQSNCKMIKTDIVLLDDVNNKQQVLKNVQIRLETDRQLKFANILQSVAEKDDYFTFLCQNEISFFVFDPFRQMYIYLPHSQENPACLSYEILQEQENLKIKYRQLNGSKNCNSLAAGAVQNDGLADDEAPPSPSALLKHHEDQITQQFYKELLERKTIPREKERTIKFAMDNVKKWRSLFKIGTFYQGVHIKLNLNQAAAILGLRRKTLDEYYKQLNDAEAKGFDFQANMNNKIGVLRKYNKQNQVISQQFRRTVDYQVKQENSQKSSKKNSYQEDQESQTYIENAVNAQQQYEQCSNENTQCHLENQENQGGEEEKYNRNPFSNVNSEYEQQQNQNQQQMFSQQNQMQMCNVKQENIDRELAQQYQQQYDETQVQYDRDIALQHQLEQLQQIPCSIINNNNNCCVNSLNNSFEFEHYCAQNKQQDYQLSSQQNNNNNYNQDYQNDNFMLGNNQNGDDDISQYIQNTSLDQYQQIQYQQQQYNYQQHVSFQLENSMNNTNNNISEIVYNNQQEQNYLQNLSFHLNNSNQNISYDDIDQQQFN